MPGYVESVAYHGQTPWYGWGTRVPDDLSIDQMLIAAELDWEVEKRRLKTLGQDEWIDVPDRYALVRSSDDRVLDVVGKSYVPSQNAEVFEFFREFLDAGQATLETAGSLMGGRLVWCLAKLRGGDFNMGPDEMKGYVLLASPHWLGKSDIIKPTSVRTVCWNTITMALQEEVASEFRHAHRSEFNAEVIQNAKETLGLATEQLHEHYVACQKLKRFRITDQMLEELLLPVVAPKFDPEGAVSPPADELVYPRNWRMIEDAYRTAPGADPGTAWGALNAITFWADHMAGRKQENRLHAAWMGSTAKIKDRAMKVLVEAAR